MQSVAIIGIGRVGGALAIALDKCGYSVDKLFVRSGKQLEHLTGKLSKDPQVLDQEHFDLIAEDIVFITTQDSEIGRVTARLVQFLKNKPKLVFHTSGSRSSDILKPLSELEINTGSIHPLTSISDPVSGSKQFKSSFFCIEGDEVAREFALTFARDLGGKPFSIESQYKTLYHASAVMASGHFVALIHLATSLLSECGLEKDKAFEILLPLIESTLANLHSQSFSEALTGTFARADLETMIRHIDSLKKNADTDALDLYLQLGTRSLMLSESAGADTESIKQMREIISEERKWGSEQS
ncbi:MAG: Rossmann-like and DUF2520 domain-containing protein [Pyrinomonadaceae bacterium]